jgi:CubicO group peptidase (beta-lactamase class C family)
MSALSVAQDQSEDLFVLQQPPSVVGRWDVTVHGKEGDYPSWFEVTQSGYRTLVGSYVGQFGSARPIAVVRNEEGAIRFAVPPQWEHRTSEVVYEGRLENDTIQGETTDDAGETIRWEARRAPKLQRSGTPVWGEPIELFNGKSLEGWKPRHAGSPHGWEVRDGLLANVRPSNDLVTEQVFDDFKLHVEFRYPEGSNSGIYLRGRYEVQIEDNFGKPADSHHIGGVYGFLTPTRNASKPAGEWQQVDITLIGRHVTVVLNGERVIDRQEIPGITGGALDSNEGAPGPMMLQGDHGPVEYRRVTLTPARVVATKLPRRTPESQGVSSEAIAKFVAAADQKVSTMHSFMLVRHGHVVAECWWEPEAAEKRHVLWSLSKSFTSTAVGMAVSEGRLSLDDRVIKFFPHDAPASPSENLAAMRVRDLLTMTTGHDTEPPVRQGAAWTKIFLNHPVPHRPGTHFLYNTAGTYMLSAIVQQVTGETVLEYLRPRLFDPLGIENPEWGTSPQGISLGGYGLSIRTEDIAKFGQFYLQQGLWNGVQLVPSDWVALATSKQVENVSDPSTQPNSDWQQGYGFQFWRCRHNAYRGDGKDGQFCIVVPELDAVVAITANTGDMQGELNVVWDYLLDAFHDQPLPENETAQAKLKDLFHQLKAKKRES